MTLGTRGNTDVLFQGVKLFIEGVEIPFEAITISSGIGGLPQASISIPPQAGITEITRFYYPKVHVFFEDNITDEGKKLTDNSKFKLLFSGIATSSTYGKYKSPSGDNVAFTLNCKHRLTPMQDCLVDYSGYFAPGLDKLTQTVKAGYSNSSAAIIEALKGIDGTLSTGQAITLSNPNGRTDALSAKFVYYKDRLRGMAGVVMNYWNQLKRSAFNPSLVQLHESFTKVYKPLIEDGLQFFQRLSGHYIVESVVDADDYKVAPCPETPGVTGKIIVPAAIQHFFKGAIQADMTVSLLQNYLQNSGEITDMYGMFSNFFAAVDYDMLTLASPAEAPVISESTADSSTGTTTSTPDTYAIETIVKPRLPFYYAPICNVLLPGMYHSLNVFMDDEAVPTRIDLKNIELGVNEANGTHFRSPPSVRKAVAAKAHGITDTDGNPLGTYKQDLAATLYSSFGAVGPFEKGRGVKLELLSMPRWLNLFSYTSAENQTTGVDKPDAGTRQDDALKSLSIGWKARFPDEDDSLNPYETTSGLGSHQRILVAAADYYYTQVFARSKTGHVDCPFNPYIIPGYPMDILEKNPVLPSFHAYCTNVTHTITASSISTSVDFTAAITYTELANYYVPFVAPFLQVVLGLAEQQTILENPNGEATADNFYYSVLGVGAAAPSTIYNFSGETPSPTDGQPNALNRVGYRLESTGSPSSIKSSGNRGEINPNLTYQGNLSMISRPIEDMKKIQARFGYSFIFMKPENYPPIVVRYEDGNLEDNDKNEIGESQFLDYPDLPTDPYPIKSTFANTKKSADT